MRFHKISILTGVQREMVFFIYESCSKNRERLSDPMTPVHLAESIGCKLGSIKTSIKRLVEKGFIKRIENCIGRGGWTRFQIPNAIYMELIDYINSPNRSTHTINRTQKGSQTDHKQITQTDTQRGTSLSSSIYDLIKENITTTTETARLQEFPEAWKEIDMEPLAPYGFSIHHLRQVFNQKKLTPEDMQDSIYAFAFDLKHNNKEKQINGEIINYFMGIVRKGIVYLYPSNYESPQDEALRLHNEHKQARLTKRTELEQQAFELSFDDWITALSSTEKEKHVPKELIPAMYRNKGMEHPGVRAALKTHFKEKVWTGISMPLPDKGTA
jgi:hypothetical protein